MMSLGGLYPGVLYAALCRSEGVVCQGVRRIVRR